jgi:methylenetetrahydrofolate dehydrogenase (NADP+)/methenyltetrahydrofolate cyclohydrolase
MPAKLIDGRKIAGIILANAREQALGLKERPSLAVLIAGEDPASLLYVQKKQQACEQVGIESKRFSFGAGVSEAALVKKIRELNSGAAVSGILVQLPLPPHIGRNRVLQAISPKKDVDGFTAENMGRLSLGIEEMVSCTAMGIVRLVESTGIALEGKNCCIVNHSIVVGRPLAQLLLNRNATVSICHRHTKNLAAFTSKADILVSAAGVPGLIKKDMVKENAIVIDAGITRKENGIAGDVDFDKVKEIASFITPVPGGVGPVTIACLMENTVKAAFAQSREA